MVFCVLHGSGAKFGPYFLPSTPPMNQHSYRQLLETKVFPDMKQSLGQAKFRQVVWQQDGARCHTSHMVMDFLDEIFEDRVVSQNCRRGMLWSASSPDMNPCDSFLWGHLKSKTYSPMPNSMPALKNKLRRKFREIPAWMVQHAILNIKKRARLCIEADGGHFEP